MENAQYDVGEILQRNLTMCNSCFRVSYEEDKWLLMGDVSMRARFRISPGQCPDCQMKKYMNILGMKSLLLEKQS